MIRLGAVLALCLSGLLAVSACTSGQAPPAAAAGTSRAPGTTSPAARGGSAASVRIGRYTLVFATPLPANPAQAKVIAGFRQSQILWTKSDEAWRLVAPIREFVTGQALTHVILAVTAGRDRHLVPAGTERFFLTNVSGIANGTATITTCDDGSKVEVKNTQTGATYTTPAGKAYILETWHMVRLSGHWAATAFSLAFPPSPRAAPCQP